MFAEKIKYATTGVKTEYAEVRDAYNEAFKVLHEYIDTFIVKQQRSQFVKNPND